MGLTGMWPAVQEVVIEIIIMYCDFTIRVGAKVLVITPYIPTPYFYNLVMMNDYNNILVLAITKP